MVLSVQPKKPEAKPMARPVISDPWITAITGPLSEAHAAIKTVISSITW
jgi:hypothetical protein